MPVHIGTYTAHVGMTIIITALFLDFLAHWALLVAFGAMVIYLLLFRLTVPYALVRTQPRAVAARAAARLRPLRAGPAPAGGRAAAARGQRAGDRSPAEREARGAGRARARPGRGAPGGRGGPLRPDPGARGDDPAARHRGHRAQRHRGRPAADLRDTKHSRIPVFGENLDDIVGVVSVRDVVEYDGPAEDPIQPLVARPPSWCPRPRRSRSC